MSKHNLTLNQALLYAAVEQRDDARKVISELRETLRPAIEAARELFQFDCELCGGVFHLNTDEVESDFYACNGCGSEASLNEVRRADSYKSLVRSNKALLEAGRILGVE